MSFKQQTTSIFDVHVSHLVPTILLVLVIQALNPIYVNYAKKLINLIEIQSEIHESNICWGILLQEIYQ